MADKTKKPKEPNPIERSFIQNGLSIYEMIGDPETETLAYVKYDKLTRQFDLCDEVWLNDKRYIPPQNSLAFSGTLLLPSFPSEYGSMSQLVENIRSFIYAYLEIPPDYLLIASYYVILSWMYDCFETIPYLRARGEYGTGKSRFLKVIGSLCYRPCFAGGSSTCSPIFRLIQLYGGMTLVLDEADFSFSGADAEIVKILNTGYSKGMPVLRTEGDRVRVPTAYNTYGPKILATRKDFEDLALESRCLTNYMLPKVRTDIPLHLPKDFDRVSRDLRNQLLMFRLEHYGEYEVDERRVVEGIEPRVNQVLLPLFALADTDEMRLELVEYAKKHAKTQVENRAESIEGVVLTVMLEMSAQNQFILVKDLARKINVLRSKDDGERMVSPAWIGKINKTSFSFETRRVNGVTQILWNEKLGRELCGRFGVKLNDEGINLEDVEDVGFVEDLFGAKLSDPDVGSPEES